VPVAKKQAGFTTFFFGFGSGPFDKRQTVFVVRDTVGFQSKMDISPYCGFFE
jgi:hypothetical protein